MLIGNASLSSAVDKTCMKDHYMYFQKTGFTAFEKGALKEKQVLKEALFGARKRAIRLSKRKKTQ